MPGQRGSERRTMLASVHVRMPEQLARAVQSAAETAGTSAASWLRLRASDALCGPPEDVRPSRPRRGLPPEDVVAVARLREAVAEAVGALVRSSAFNRVSGDPLAISVELEALIPRFRQAAFALDDLKASLLL